MEVVSFLLKLSEIGEQRLRLRWVSAAEAQAFVQYVTEFSEQIYRLGPFDPRKYQIQLEGLERALMSSRLRWLMGKALQLTERGNVFGKNLSREDYQNLLCDAARKAYEESLLLQVLETGPQSVRDVAFQTGLDVHRVSLRLGDLERRRQAQFDHYEGRTPKFVAAAS